ncbi:MAG: D-alanine--D-alanine ligase, partial [Bacteroidota bacterium]
MKKIAILCGGYSGEYEISVQTAQMVQQNLENSPYDTYLIYIETTGWYYLDAQKNRYEIDRSDFSLLLPSGKVHFDGLFNAIHGTPGEDGVILGYFDLLGIPYTSCSMEVSALTFNKYLFNLFAQAIGIRVARSFNFTRKQYINPQKVINTLGLPVFVKPAKSGSSVGVSR